MSDHPTPDFYMSGPVIEATSQTSADNHLENAGLRHEESPGHYPAAVPASTDRLSIESRLLCRKRQSGPSLMRNDASTKRTLERPQDQASLRGLQSIVHGVVHQDSKFKSFSEPSARQTDRCKPPVSLSTPSLPGLPLPERKRRRSQT